jgi:hypothetical protein
MFNIFKKTMMNLNNEKDEKVINNTKILSYLEKINETDEYEKRKGVYLEISVDGCVMTKIYKYLFRTLDTYNLIINLYEACLSGLEFKSFKTTSLCYYHKLTVSFSFEFDDNNILNIREHGYNFGADFIHIEINDINKNAFFGILSWIKKSLEEFHPELNEGFVSIICGFYKNEKTSLYEPFQIDSDFIGKFKKTYGEDCICDEHLELESKLRQDLRIFDLIESSKIKNLKLKIYKVPKFVLPYSKIIFTNSDEYIKIDRNLLFYAKFYNFEESVKKQYFLSDEEKYKFKSNLFEKLENFNNLITGLDYGLKVIDKINKF